MHPMCFQDEPYSPRPVLRYNPMTILTFSSYYNADLDLLQEFPPWRVPHEPEVWHRFVGLLLGTPSLRICFHASSSSSDRQMTRGQVVNLTCLTVELLQAFLEAGSFSPSIHALRSDVTVSGQAPCVDCKKPCHTRSRAEGSVCKGG